MRGRVNTDKYRMNNLRHWIDAVSTLTEARSAPLYHATGFWAAEQIFERGHLEAGDNSLDRDEFYNISTTRNPRLRYYQDEGQDRYGHAPIQFVLNQETIAQRHRLSPADYGVGDEQEEKVHAQELPILHVTAIQFFSVPKDFVPSDNDEYFIKEMGGRNAGYARIAALASDADIPVIDLRRRSTRTIMKAQRR